MPYSSSNGKAELLAIAKKFLPGDVLDLGVGSGTYSDLLKQHVPHFDPMHRMTGVEVWVPYVEQFNLRHKYADLMLMDAHKAVEALRQRGKRFNLILIGDMLEHVSRVEALTLVEQCKQLLEPQGALIISVPIGEYPQDEYEGNPYEAHVDTWHVTDVMRDLKPISFIQRGEIGIVTLFADNERGRRMCAPRIDAYMICKDEVKFIERCLGSLAGCGEVVVVDTGSTDGTIELIEELAESADIKLLKATVAPWRFDDARNLALSAVSPKADLCISIDADEVLSPGFVEHIEKAWVDGLLAGIHYTRFNHSFQTIWDWQDKGNSVTKHFHERVHARLGYRWIHPVHEKLVSDAEVAGWCTEALMTQLPDMKKGRPYLEPLKLAVEEDPKDWKLWTFLAAELEQHGQGYAEARNAYEQALLQPGADATWIRIQLMLLAERHNNLGAARSNIAIFTQDSNLREAFMYAAEFHTRQGETRRALDYYYQAEACAAHTQGYMRREDAWDGGLDRAINSLINSERDE